MAKPLVIDLPSEDRAALEAQMKKGIVFVTYDCVNVTVLPNCHVPDGSYEYAGVNRKEQVVQLKSQDDLKVNLPLSVGKFGTDISSGRTLDLALVLVGLKSTTVDNMPRAGLTGTCDGATHFLRTAYIGAFSLATGSVGKVHAVADLFKVGGATGSSEASRSAENTDGSLDACRTSDSDAPKPPQECSSPVRVQLQPIRGAVVGSAGAADADANATDAGAGADPAKPVVADNGTKVTKPAPPENPCREGYVLADGICTKAVDAPHQCSPDDPADCRAQCDKGNAASCYAATKQLDESASLPFYKKACDGNYADGCQALAVDLYVMNAPPGPQNNAESVALAKKGCDLGGGSSCQLLGEYFESYSDIRSGRRDMAVAFHSYERGCALGSDEACGSLGDLYLSGNGVDKDPAKAMDLYDRACLGAQYGKCEKLGKHLATGDDGVTRDPARAMRVARRFCAEDVHFCDDSSSIAFSAGFPEEGFAIATKACSQLSYSCLWLGDLYAQGKGTKKDVRTAKRLWTKACENGTGLREACEKAHIKTKP